MQDTPGFFRGILTPRNVGRGFWLGILVSLVLHGWLIGSDQFSFPQFGEIEPPAPPIEARLEPLPEVPKPPPVTFQPAQTPIAPSATPPTPNPPASLPSAPAQSATPPVLSTPPTPAPSELALPLPASNQAEAPARSPVSALIAKQLKSLPARIEIVFELEGMLSGRQTHRWQRNGQQYTLETEAEAKGLVGLFVRGKLTQRSSGRIGTTGLMPERFDMQRPNGKKEHLEFDYQANQILADNGKRQLELPLITGAQDPLSAIYQLAMSAQEDSEGILVAAGTKRVKGYPYRSHGRESIRTALGTIQTIPVTRSGESGSQDVRLWLSPEHHYLPVRVSYVDEDGTEWILEATSLRFQD